MSGSEYGIAGTDTTDPIISGDNRPAIEGRAGAYIADGTGNDQMWGLGGGSTTYGDAGDDAPYAGPGTDTVKSGDSNTVHGDDDSDGAGQ